MRDKFFVDTNILIYARDRSAGFSRKDTGGRDALRTPGQDAGALLC